MVCWHLYIVLRYTFNRDEKHYLRHRISSPRGTPLPHTAFHSGRRCCRPALKSRTATISDAPRHPRIAPGHGGHHTHFSRAHGAQASQCRGIDRPPGIAWVGAQNPQQRRQARRTSVANAARLKVTGLCRPRTSQRIKSQRCSARRFHYCTRRTKQEAPARWEKRECLKIHPRRLRKTPKPNCATRP